MITSVSSIAAPVQSQVSNSATTNAATTVSSPPGQPVASTLRMLSLELLLAFPLGLLLSRLQIGSLAWIFSGLVVAAGLSYLYQTFNQPLPPPNRSARKVGLSLVGLTIGSSISQANLAPITSHLPIFALLTFFLLLSGSAIGYCYARLSGTNLLTALLATVPGGVGVMASLAADYDRNVTQVALVQIIRVTAVILGIPLLSGLISGTGINRVVLQREWLSFEPIALGLLCLALLTTGATVTLAGRLGIPAAPFLAAVVVGTSFNPLLTQVSGLDLHFCPPLLVSVLGQILLGLTIGEYWGSQWQTPAQLGRRSISGAFLSVMLTLSAGLLAAAIAHHLTTWDWLTCLLVTAPGGAPEMILVALSMNHQVETVTAAHLVRLIAINGSLPLWIYLFSRLDPTPATAHP